MITPQQTKQARALLGCTQRELADQAAGSVKTPAAFEEGRMLLVKMHKAVLRELLEGASVCFAEGNPVTLKVPKALRHIHGG
jgi:predicted transcriptional regulator